MKNSYDEIISDMNAKIARKNAAKSLNETRLILLAETTTTPITFGTMCRRADLMYGCENDLTPTIEQENKMKNLNWNPETDDIHELLSELNEIQEKCDNPDVDFGYQRVEDAVDFSDLPSAREIPDEIADYPVWAIDRDGNCLVGDSADGVESLESITNYYENQ